MPTTLALIDRTGRADFRDMQTVAIAISTQVQADLARAWSVAGQVVALSDPSQLTPGMSPIYLVDTLPAGEGGVHFDDTGQVYALVEYGEAWHLAASHEACEMLVDPSGHKLQTGVAIGLNANGDIIDAPGTFQYIVEICDPCETKSYVVDGVAVSDFYLPSFFDAAAVPGQVYSRTGALTRPRTVIAGGYLSWLNPTTNTIQQLDWTGAAPVIKDLGPTAQVTGRALREFIDARTRPPYSLSTFGGSEERRRQADEARDHHLRETAAYGARWERTVEALYKRAARNCT
jgi:hypothetical protein